MPTYTLHLQDNQLREGNFSGDLWVSEEGKGATAYWVRGTVKKVRGRKVAILSSPPPGVPEELVYIHKKPQGKDRGINYNDELPEVPP